MNKKNKKRAPVRRVVTRTADRRRQRLALWLGGVLVALSTMVFSRQLGDVSFVPRMICMALTLALTAAAMARSGRKWGVGGGAWIVALLLLLWQVASLLWATNVAEGYYELAKWLLLLAGAWLSFLLFRRWPVRMVCMLSRVSAAVFVVSAGVAVWQLLEISDLTWASRYSVVSLYTHKGTFSMLLLLLMVFPAMRLALGVRRARWFYVALLALELALPLFLQARATLLAGVAVAVVWPLMWFAKWRVENGKWRVALTLLLALLAGVAVVAGSRAFANYDMGMPDNTGGIRSNASVHERQELWRMTFRMIDEQPLVGCGTGNWQVCYPRVSTADVFSIDVLDYVFLRPHNEYLRVLSETGYVGLALLLIALSSLLLHAFWAGGRRRRAGRMAAVGGAFVMGLLVFALFDFPLDRTELLLWSALAIGAVAAAGCRRKAEGGGRSVAVWVLWIVSGLMVVVALYGVSRWKSEACYRDIARDIHQRRWPQVAAAAQQAQTPFCNIASTGMPYAYYEAMALEYQKLDAYDAFSRARAAMPYNKQVLCDLGRIEYVQHHAVDTSIALLREAIRISPSFSHAHFNLAQVYLQEGRYDEAEEALLAMDIEGKSRRINQMVWHYHSGETALYYQHAVIEADSTTRNRMLQQVNYLRTINL